MWSASSAAARSRLSSSACDLAALALHPGERLGGGGEAGVVGVEPARRARPRAGTGGGELGVGAAHSLLGVGELGRRRRPTRRCASSSAAAVAPPAAAPTRQPVGAEAVAVVGDDDGVGMGDRERRSRRPTSATRTASPIERVEQRRQPGPVGRGRAGARARRRPAHGAPGVCAHRRRATAPLVSESRSELERAPAESGAVDDDRVQRLAERGLDRRLPPVVDLDEVEQRAEHAVDIGEALGAGTGPGDVERQLQRLDARRPARRDLGRLLACLRSPTRSCGLGDATAAPRPARPRRRAASRRPRRRRSRRAAARSRRRAGRRVRATASAALGTPAQLALAALDGRAHRPQLAAHLGRRAGRLDAATGRRQRRPTPARARRANASSSSVSCSASGAELRRARRRPSPARRRKRAASASRLATTPASSS